MAIKETTPAKQRELIKRLAKLDPKERQELRLRVLVLFNKADRIVSRKGKTESKTKETKIDPANEAAIELYAVKSFQAQDMSGRFNRSRMNQAIKEAKPKKEVRRG